MHLRRDDRGVTLTEVLVAITILAIIIVPLSDALIGFVRNTDATTRRMNESHDIQLAGAYFARDVQNLGVRQWSPPTQALQQSIRRRHRLRLHRAGHGGRQPGLGRPDHRLRYARVIRSPTSSGMSTASTSCGGCSAAIRHRAALPGGGTPTWWWCTTWSARHPPVCVPSPCTGAGAAVPQRVTLTLTIKDPASPTATTVILTGQRGQT